MQTLDFPSEFKAIDESGSFEGLAAAYGNVDRGGDVIQPGAFLEFDLTKDGQVRILDQHRANSPIGKARITDTATGLSVAGRLNLAVSYARNTYELMKDGTLGALSIGYDVLQGGSEMKNGVRHLTGLKLWEISVVTFPMNPMATVTGVKSAMSCANIREFEDLAREALNLSARQAKRLASAAWPALHADPEPDDHEIAILAAKFIDLTNILRATE